MLQLSFPTRRSYDLVTRCLVARSFSRLRAPATCAKLDPVKSEPYRSDGTCSPSSSRSSMRRSSARNKASTHQRSTRLLEKSDRWPMSYICFRFVDSFLADFALYLELPSTNRCMSLAEMRLVLQPY